jgi:multidrug efflux pump subunit AcrB
MAIAMLSLLMIQVQSFSRLALVFVTAPLGLIGATGALEHDFVPLLTPTRR